MRKKLENEKEAERFIDAILSPPKSKNYAIDVDLLKYFIVAYPNKLADLLEKASEKKLVELIWHEVTNNNPEKSKLLEGKRVKECLKKIFTEYPYYDSNDFDNINMSISTRWELMIKPYFSSKYVKYKQYELYIKNEDIEKFLELANGNDISKVELVVEDISKLTEENLKKLQGLGMKRITISNGRFCKTINDTRDKIYRGKIYVSKYKLNDLITYRKEIDKIIADIDVKDTGDGNYQKKLFVQVAKRIIERIEYDYKGVRLETVAVRISNVQKKLGKYKIKDKKLAIISSRILSKTDERHMRDLAGLVTGKSVCAGYAKITQNIMACLGINCKYIEGITNEKGCGHAWNQVELDGEWYNDDLCWATQGWLENLLVNTEDFNVEHGKYSYKRTEGEEICKRTIPIELIEEWYYGKDEKKEWLSQVASRCDKGKMQKIVEEFAKCFERKKDRGNIEK